MGLGALGLYFLGCLQKKKKKKIINQNFQFLEKIQDFQIFQKKKGETKDKIQFFLFFQKKKKNHQSKFSIP